MIFTDQLHRTIELKEFPEKIISLVPSQSELLYDLGLEKQLAGITKFCIHPPHMYHSVPRIGGTKNLDFEKIKAINPDLIIGNKEENEKTQVAHLIKQYPVWMSDVKTVDDAFAMIMGIGNITNKTIEARSVVAEIKAAFNRFLPPLKQAIPRNKAAYLIWNNPYMSVSNDTFIHDMLSKAGFENVFADETARYPVISLTDLQNAKPGYIFLSSEPFPFKEIHRAQLAKDIPSAKVVLVDGALFSWYGSRLKLAPAYLSLLINK